MQFLKFHKNNKLLIFVFLAFLNAEFTSQLFSQKKYTVVLDAGHGGKDSGNLGNGYKEKNIALRVALDVGKELLTSKDIEVVYTRKKDVFIELHNRAKIANNKKADLFVSIHCDAFTRPDPHGASTFVLGLSGNKENLEIARKENAVILLEDNYKQNYDYDPNSPESLIGLSVLQEENLDLSLAFGGLVQNNFVNLKRNNRRVKQANFLVLRETVMPSVLIELGFLTNKNEGRFLNSRQGQIKMAKAIAEAIRNYIERLKLNTVRSNAPLEITVTNKKEEKTNKTVVAEKAKEKQPEPKEIVVTKKQPETPKVEEKTTEVVTTKPKTEPKITEIKKETNAIEFMVQIAASKRKLNTANFNFKGLEGVQMKTIDGYYKYFYGNSSDFQKIKQDLAFVKTKGFKDAWVVAFKNDKKISLREALKSK